MSDDTPTVPFDSPTSPRESPPDPEKGRSRAIIIALSIIGGLLLIAVVVLLTLLLSGRLGAQQPGPSPDPSTSPLASQDPIPSDTPSSDPTESSAETAEPTETSPPPPPPPPPPAIIASYGASPKTVDCSGGGPVPVTFSWSTSGAKVSFGVGTEFADSQPLETDLPAAHSYQWNYQCGQSGNRQVYSIAVFDNGSNVIARQTVTVTETS